MDEIIIKPTVDIAKAKERLEEEKRLAIEEYTSKCIYWAEAIAGVIYRAGVRRDKRIADAYDVYSDNQMRGMRDECYSDNQI